MSLPTEAAPRARSLASLVPLAAGLLLALPTLVARFPPMTDLPLHDAVVGTLRHLHDPGFFPPDLYRLNLGHPNQLFHLCAWALSYVMSVDWACKLVIAAAQIGILVAGGRLARHPRDHAVDGAAPLAAGARVDLLLGTGGEPGRLRAPPPRPAEPRSRGGAPVGARRGDELRLDAAPLLRARERDGGRLLGGARLHGRSPAPPPAAARDARPARSGALRAAGDGAAAARADADDRRRRGGSFRRRVERPAAQTCSMLRAR